MFEALKKRLEAKHAAACAEGNHKWKVVSTETRHTFGGDGENFAYTVKVAECRWCHVSEDRCESKMCPLCGAVNMFSHNEEVDPGYNTEVCLNCGHTTFHDFSVPCLE